jgi:surface antigen
MDGEKKAWAVPKCEVVPKWWQARCGEVCVLSRFSLSRLKRQRSASHGVARNSKQSKQHKQTRRDRHSTKYKIIFWAYRIYQIAKRLDRASE